MKKVVLACRYEDIGYFNRDIFCRKDMKLRESGAASCNLAFQSHTSHFLPS